MIHWGCVVALPALFHLTSQMASQSPPAESRKRSRDELEAKDKQPTFNAPDADGKVSVISGVSNLTRLVGSSSDGDDLGPALPAVAGPKKKKRKLPYEKLYISAFPSSPRYHKSLMHKEQLSFIAVSAYSDFLITTSTDGVVKFWKKVNVGVEFVKEYKAHSGEIRSVSVSQDGRSLATAGADATIKIFDVASYGWWIQ